MRVFPCVCLALTIAVSQVQVLRAAIAAALEPQGPPAKQTSGVRGELPSQRWPDLIDLTSTRVYQVGRPAGRPLGDRTPTSGPLRIGPVRPLSPPLNPLTDGRVSRPEAHTVSVLIVAAEGSARLRVHLERVQMPAGARLYIHGGVDRGEVFGPYADSGPSGSQEFWSPPVEGDRAVLEYIEHRVSGAAERPSRGAPFIVTEVAHPLAAQRRPVHPEGTP